MIKEAVTETRWQKAQISEKTYHIYINDEESYNNYKLAYSYYFKYLNIDLNLNNKSIIEIGPAKWSALLYCNNYNQSYVVEPIKYDNIEKYYDNKNISFIYDCYENCISPKVDEIWLFNLMQHVKDPDLLIKKAKLNCDTIRFFEPIDLPTDIAHPFTFSLNDYIRYFGDCVKVYNSIGEPNFHQATCVYGVYKCH